MENNFESGRITFNKQHQLPGDSIEEPKTVLTIRDWEDKDLPPNVETFSFNAKFKRYKKYNDEKDSPTFADLEGIGFGISKEKLDSVSVGQGDEIRVEKLASDGTYHGDGIVKVVNVTKRLSATIKDWEESRKKLQ